MKNGKKKREKSKEVVDNQDFYSSMCSFSWEKLVEMKDNKTQFFAGDGFKRIRILDIDEKTKRLHMICDLGKKTWPLKFEKLEELHKKVHSGEVTLIPYEIDKLMPTWGNFVTGLFRFLGCRKSQE